MRQLPEASVHAVVTDPPYGINFMGKAWDAPGGMLGQMATGYADNDNAAFGAWCETWLTECLRVLKPGGHLLAFGGTRTWHRLACAVEDAGFEVRDSIAWLYGSGFPKSLDVSKAIDRQRHDRDDVRRVTAWVATARATAGITNRDIDAAFGFNGMAGHWTTQGAQAAIPTLDQVPTLLAVLGIDADDVPDEIRALLIDLNGMKGQPGPAWFAREITQAEARPLVSGETISFDQRSSKERERRDIPATPDAERWQGWGTALKPSFEGIVCATKPVPALARIGSRLDELEQSCRPPASGAVPSSAPTHPDSLGARTASAPASAATRREDEPARTTPTGAAAGSPAATATSASELTGATFWNTVTSWKACWAELCEATSTSTTGTTSSTTTDLETLWCCLSQITPESTTTDPTSPDGLSSFVGAVDAMFAAAVLNSRATRTLTAIGSATSGTPPTSPAAGGSRAAFEPVVVARKPLIGTVAANVLAHGTGALNIDGCRIEHGGNIANADGGGQGAGYEAHNKPARIYGKGLGGIVAEPHTSGRWPANVVLDESQAEALDEQSGTLTSPGSYDYGTPDTGNPRIYGNGAGVPKTERREGHGDSGGASRFFYVAKADTTERPTGNGTAHPTVKPLDLMRWLVRLVTPPGGIVLEPFAGSGTTVEACIKEDVRCVAIEREADYLPLIDERINRNNLSLFAGGAS